MQNRIEYTSRGKNWRRPEFYNPWRKWFNSEIIDTQRKKEKQWKVNPMFLWKNTDCIENKFRHHFFHVQFWCVQSKLTMHEIFLTSATIKKLFLYMSSYVFSASNKMRFFLHRGIYITESQQISSCVDVVTSNEANCD